jgi:hypothetical protein
MTRLVVDSQHPAFHKSGCPTDSAADRDASRVLPGIVWYVSVNCSRGQDQKERLGQPPAWIRRSLEALLNPVSIRKAALGQPQA